MRIVGVIGGIASGKSVVTSELARLGARVLDADKIGHEVLRLPEVRRAVVARWGEGILGPDGEIHRRSLAQIVFDPTPRGAAELAALEAMTHPEISRRMQEQLADWRASGDTPVAVLDAPILLKAGWDRLCDSIVFVEAPEAIRVARAASRGWTAEEFFSREAAQESLDVKRRRADTVIDNSSSLEFLQHQVNRFWHSLLGTSAN